jgi:hypothetical protein
VLKPFLTVGLLVLLVGCATGSPPTATERALYQVTTNFVTNVNQVAVVGTNGVVTATNWVTNVFQTFDLQPRASVEAGIRAGGVAATGFGFGLGGVIATILTAVYGAWATWKNVQNAKLAATFANNVQVYREVVRAQPSGTVLDEKLKEQIKAQQVESGVKEQAAKVVETKVNTVEAKAAAKNVLNE